MTDNNDDDVADDSIKSQLYELYIDIKHFQLHQKKKNNIKKPKKRYHLPATQI